MKLAFSTNAYTNDTLPEAVRRIAAHGYEGVELLGDTPHAYFPKFGADDATALGDALTETDLAVSNINANTATGYYDDAPPSSFFEPSVINPDPDLRAWRVEYTKRAIDLATSTGAPAVCLATGRPLPGTLPDEAYQFLLDSLHDILDYAEPRGVDVGIEFEPELLIECTDEVLTLIDDVGRDNLGVNLDIGHAAVYGEDLRESIEQSAGHITGVHLEDIAGGIRGKHYHLVPGDGDLDFDAVFDALDSIGYDGFVTLELYTYPDRPDEAAARAFEALADYF
ncbi:sugar phosphate isomerase/epimerase [Halogeometricum borinquense]|uniref:Sugar phosphate isomerase/epimerase n=1 Tax=Halogeometricum borinquense TaxID=60847 RepID=A0A6C0UGI7_9EURY|nr:sugar phosphate isomerase/epimerase family protein [Halogeometricum borinquense]QIB74535.1 sugar phosphate isomerase/epimerase [Halogeometricum borinquense]QIQ76522.1 sugar phosphate isomerase/epimerase [Halogeometricum borinquense]